MEPFVRVTQLGGDLTSATSYFKVERKSGEIAWYGKTSSAASVARASSSPEMAAEIYLASALVVDETTMMERAYLDELAKQLKLDAGLKAALEARARTA